MPSQKVLHVDTLLFIWQSYRRSSRRVFLFRGFRLWKGFFGWLIRHTPVPSRHWGIWSAVECFTCTISSNSGKPRTVSLSKVYNIIRTQLVFIFTTICTALATLNMHQISVTSRSVYGRFIKSLPHPLTFVECVIFRCEYLDLFMRWCCVLNYLRVKSTLNKFQFQSQNPLPTSFPASRRVFTKSNHLHAAGFWGASEVQ